MAEATKGLGGAGSPSHPQHFAPVTSASDFLLHQPPGTATSSGHYLAALFSDGPQWGLLTPSESWRFAADFYFSRGFFSLPAPAIQELGTRGLIDMQSTLASQVSGQNFS